MKQDRQVQTVKIVVLLPCEVYMRICTRRVGTVKSVILLLREVYKYEDSCKTDRCDQLRL